MQTRGEDDSTRRMLAEIDDHPARVCLAAEREFLRLLHGDCNQPVGVLATLNGTGLRLRAQVFLPNKVAPMEATVEGPGAEAISLAAELLNRINEQR